jgi:hypothetical protein
MIKILSREEKQQLVFQAVANIAAGIPVKLIDASGCAYAVCIGDLRDYGWDRKNLYT